MANHTYVVKSITNKGDTITNVGGTVDGVGVNIAFQNQSFANVAAFEAFIAGLMEPAAFPPVATNVTSIVGTVATSQTFIVSFTSTA